MIFFPFGDSAMCTAPSICCRSWVLVVEVSDRSLLPEYGVEYKADGKCYYFLLSSQDSSYIINCFLHSVFYLITFLKLHLLRVCV